MGTGMGTGTGMGSGAGMGTGMGMGTGTGMDTGTGMVFLPHVHAQCRERCAHAAANNDRGQPTGTLLGNLRVDFSRSLLQETLCTGGTEKSMLRVGMKITQTVL